MKKLIPVFALLIIFLTSTAAQRAPMQLTDYERALSFSYDRYYNKTAFNLYTRPHWFADGTGMWFLEYSAAGKFFKSVDFVDYRVAPLFDQVVLADQLSQLTGDTLQATALPFDSVEKIGQDSLQFSYQEKEYYFEPTKNKLSLQAPAMLDLPTRQQSISPDGQWIVYAKNDNLFLVSVKTGEEHQLSVDGQPGYSYGSWYGWFDQMEGENGKRPARFGVNWSPDSKWFMTNICDTRNADKMYLLDWSKDEAYRPNLLSYYRGSPGDTTMVKMQAVFYQVATKKEVKTVLPQTTHINSVRHTWSATSGVVYANYAARGFQKEYLLRLDLKQNESTILVEETSKTNIDNFEYRIVEKLGKAFFLSERSGWRQLYKLDLATQKTEALTRGDYYIHELHYLNEETGDIYFTAAGKEAGSNPYHDRLYRCDLNGKVQLLTPELGHHIISFAPEGNYFSDSYSTVSTPTKTVLRVALTGKTVAALTEAQLDAVQFANWQAPEVFQLIAKDGKTDIYGAIWKPTNFDPQQKYPIIDHSYTGPHTQVFPRSFDKAVQNQALAELGFIVVMVDGLGTARRAKSFHDHSYKNMGNNLEDHVLAIRQLAKKYAWIDIDRVGIFGHSAGGYDAGHGMLAFPEFYKVGVASSADHDFRMEKAWWPEMYMGWPVDETYEAVSNISLAGNLQGKLLLVHGALDDNVNPSATFKLAEALIKANKEFDLLILPSQRHGYQGIYRKYFIKKRWNYFIEHLAERQAIWDFPWE